MQANHNTLPLFEEWRPIPGFESTYEVSDQGRIKRVGKAARQGKGWGGGALVGRVRKPQKNWGGYLSVQLWREGGQFPILVHRAVASAFIGPLPDGKEVNHKDGNKQNNWWSNLEYVTRSENNLHAYQTGLHKVNEGFIANNRARRVPRVMVDCACGCGTQIETPDHQARPRRFANGHYMKLRRRLEKEIPHE